jgi:hypothetical protein
LGFFSKIRDRLKSSECCLSVNYWVNG